VKAQAVLDFGSHGLVLVRRTGNASQDAIIGGFTSTRYLFHLKEFQYVDVRDWVYLASPDYVEVE